ncbi:MAG: InlB B-repeat-containing protein [Clostridia bacterium]|nr:InlB B-repeat-containing protein [Clostridia bacterium]
MKKRFILSTGLIILIALLLCTVAAAQAETPQPTKTAAHWKSEGYVVLSDRELPENFIVLSKDLTYLKEKTAGGGTVVNGNKFALSNYNVVQPQNSTEGQDAYCIEAGGKLYFGMRDADASDENTLVLKQDEMAAADGITPQIAIAAAPYTLGAWIDWDPHFDLDDVKIKDIPFDFHGDVHFFLDHWSDSAENTTHHTIQCYFELNMDDMGFATDTETTTDDAHVPIFSYRGIKIIYISMKLDHFEGDLGVGFSIHDGLKIYFDTWGVVPISEITAERDGPRYDSQVSNAACHGDVEIGFEAGIGSSVEPLVQNQSLTIGFGYTIEGTDNKDRFVPADTKVKWHACDECWNEDVRDRIGPVNVVYDLVGFDPWTWSSDDYETDPWYSWYYSKTFDDYGSGECPHYSYRLDATVVNQHDNPIPNVNVSWNAGSHYQPQASGTTDNMGHTVIYVQAGEGRDITAEAVSTLDPSQVISQKLTITKKSDRDGIRFVLDIPEKHVYFKNSQTGEATTWPEDISFMPFFSEKVQIPDTVPGLSGRVFTGWNTKEDGSGTSYAPGTGLILSDDLTLWAQWEIPENEWYVIYNANGGTKAPGPQIVPKGRDAVLTTELPEGGKLIFKGWTPDPQTQDPVYQPGDTLKYDSGKNYVVLYALWNLSPVPEPIHISFNANGVQDAVVPADIWTEMGTWLQLEPAYAPLGSPLAFLGWSEDPGVKDPEYQAGRSYYFYRDTQLFAIWDKQDSVTLTFLDSLPDASSDIPNPITIYPSISPYVHIPDQIPQKSGRVFTGWNTKKDGSGTAYAPGSVMTLRKSAVLWAQWEIPVNSWYVIYDANGGTKAPVGQIIPLGKDAVLTTELPEAGKMIFKGWTPDPQTMNPVYQPGDTLKYDSGKNYVVLYALWNLSPVPEPIHISFDANGLKDAAVPADVWFEQGTWLLLEPAFAPAGSPMAFLGWSEDSGAVEPEFQAGQSYYFYRDTQLFAVWGKLDSVTLTFLDSLPDAAAGIPDPITIYPSISPYVCIPDRIPEKDGRVFTGWNTKQDGSGTAYAPGSVMTLRKNAELWAQWNVSGNSWYVVYNANGGTKAPGTQIIQQGKDAVLTTELPENGTLVFKGWTPNPQTQDPLYQPGDTLKYDSEKNVVVLYALWDLSPAERSVLITFKANGGLSDTVPGPLSRPKSVWFLLPASEPVWDAQHLFLGWSDDPEAAEAKWKAGAAVVFDQDTTLYAVWNAQYKVISGSGSVWVKKSTVTQRFIADGDIRYFVELRIDGKRFTKGVEISSGSTVADIKPWAMETLSAGMHKVTFVYEDGEASAPFTVKKALPPTGDRSAPALWLFLILFGLAGITLVGVLAHSAKKKR